MGNVELFSLYFSIDTAIILLSITFICKSIASIYGRCRIDYYAMKVYYYSTAPSFFISYQQVCDGFMIFIVKCVLQNEF